MHFRPLPVSRILTCSHLVFLLLQFNGIFRPLCLFRDVFCVNIYFNTRLSAFSIIFFVFYFLLFCCNERCFLYLDIFWFLIIHQFFCRFLHTLSAAFTRILSFSPRLQLFLHLIFFSIHVWILFLIFLLLVLICFLYILFHSYFMFFFISFILRSFSYFSRPLC